MVICKKKGARGKRQTPSECAIPLRRRVPQMQMSFVSPRPPIPRAQFPQSPKWNTAGNLKSGKFAQKKKSAEKPGWEGRAQLANTEWAVGKCLKHLNERKEKRRKNKEGDLCPSGGMMTDQ